MAPQVGHVKARSRGHTVRPKGSRNGCDMNIGRFLGSFSLQKPQGGMLVGWFIETKGWDKVWEVFWSSGAD